MRLYGLALTPLGVVALTPDCGHLVREVYVMGRQRREFTSKYKDEAVKG